MVRLFLWGLLVGSTEGVAAGPDEYSATPANNDEEADFFVRFFASLLYYTMYNMYGARFKALLSGPGEGR